MPVSPVPDKQPKPNFSDLGSEKAPDLRDVVPELATLGQAVRTYDKMVNGDATVDISLRGAKTPVLAAEFFVEAYDEKPENQDIFELVKYNIFDGLDRPFSVVLQEILKMYEHGYRPFEVVYENRPWTLPRQMANKKVYTFVKKIASRPAPTIAKIEYDDHGLLSKITQNAIQSGNRSKQLELPLDRMVIFTFNGDSGRIEGKSLLRTAYKHWYYKEHLYKIDAIQAERHGVGVPEITLPPGYTTEDKEHARELGRNLRSNEESYILKTPGLEVGFAKVEGNLVEPLKSIEHHNVMILLNVMMEFLVAGVESSGGGRATSAAQLNMFEKSLKYVANYICDVFNLEIIPRLVRYNFDTFKYPKMQVRNIGEAKDLLQMATAFANLADKQLITPDMGTEQYIRKLFDMPAKEEERPAAPEPSQGNNVVGNTKAGFTGKGTTEP